MSNPMIAAFQIVEPSKNPYPGSFCLPQVPLPVSGHECHGARSYLRGAFDAFSLWPDVGAADVELLLAISGGTRSYLRIAG
jgi:hypothetical protein